MVQLVLILGFLDIIIVLSPDWGSRKLCTAQGLHIVFFGGPGLDALKWGLSICEPWVFIPGVTGP